MRTLVKKRLFEKYTGNTNIGTPTQTSLATTANGSLFIIPEGYMLEMLVFEETNGAEVVIDVGVVSGGGHIISSLTITASAVQNVEINEDFDLTGNNTVYISSSDWNGASLNVYGLLRKIK